MALRSHPATVAALTLFAWAAVNLGAQAVTVSRVADAVAVRAPAFTFIKGDPLVRLKNGRSVRVELDLAVLAKPGDSAAARTQQVFVLSYDLWEERFAVTLVGTPQKSVAYLTSAAAEAWCLDQLKVPVATLGRLGIDVPFWIRLEYRIPDAEPAPAQNDDAGLTLRGLIDALSLRRQEAPRPQVIEAGPFRIRP